MKTFKLLYISIFSLCALKYSFCVAAVFNHNKLWDRSELTVCFASMAYGTGSREASKSLRVYGEAQVEFSNQKIDLITNTIKNEFSIELTGIEFTGFDFCDKNTKSDVVIIGSAKVRKGKRSALAHSTVGKTKTGVRYMIFVVNKNKTEEVYKDLPETNTRFGYYVVHEAGHILGMKHEHEMGAALADPNCQKIYKDKGKPQKTNHLIDGGLFGDIQSATYKNYGGYDSESVMNYCFVKQRDLRSSRSTFLSPIDQEALRSVYNHNNK